MILFDKIKSALGNQITGITVHANKDGQPEIYLLSLKNDRGKVKIISSPESISDLNQVGSIIDTKIPVWLTLTGRNVISRKIDKDPGERYLQTILPNAKESDFVISVTKSAHEAVIVSAIRLDYFTEILGHLHNQNLNVMGVSIGPASIQVCYDANLLNRKEVIIPGYKLQFEGQLVQIHSSEFKDNELYKIHDLEIYTNQLLSFSAALNYLISGKGYESIIPAYESDSEKYIFSRLNRLMALGSLAFIFILLLINFMFFSHYSSRQQALSSELAYKNSFFIKYDSLRNEIAMKKKLINQMRLTDKSRFGFYADRLAATVPDKIILTEISINKPIGKNRPGTVVEFDRLIHVSGIVNGSVNLNIWIKELKKLEWITEVEIENYETIDNMGEFKLNVSY